MPSQTTPPAPRPAVRSPQRKTAAPSVARPRKAVKAAPPDGAAASRVADPSDSPEVAEAAEAADSAASSLVPAPGPALLEGPTREAMIRVRAYERYERNGCVGGRELDDWLAAEAEVGALLMTGGERAAAAGAGQPAG